MQVMTQLVIDSFKMNKKVYLYFMCIITQNELKHYIGNNSLKKSQKLSCFIGSKGWKPP